MTTGSEVSGDVHIKLDERTMAEPRESGPIPLLNFGSGEQQCLSQFRENLAACHDWQMRVSYEVEMLC